MVVALAWVQRDSLLEVADHLFQFAQVFGSLVCSADILAKPGGLDPILR
jgi:hypothetical protein